LLYIKVLYFVRVQKVARRLGMTWKNNTMLLEMSQKL